MVAAVYYRGGVGSQIIGIYFDFHYWALGLRNVGKIKVHVQCMGSSVAQQENAANCNESNNCWSSNKNQAECHADNC